MSSIALGLRINSYFGASDENVVRCSVSRVKVYIASVFSPTMFESVLVLLQRFIPRLLADMEEARDICKKHVCLCARVMFEIQVNQLRSGLGQVHITKW
jgi:hypothetical protein